MTAWLLPMLLPFIQGGKIDVEPLRRVAIQHGGRLKPMDTFAREVVWALSGKKSFWGYRDPVSGKRVVVFEPADPMHALLQLLSRPGEYEARPLIRIDHPGLKETLGLDPERKFFACRELRAVREKLEAEVAGIPEEPKERDAEDRALVAVVRRYRFLEGIFSGMILRVLPVPVGKDKVWPSVREVQLYLSGHRMPEEFVRAVRIVPSGKLQRVADFYRALLEAYGKGDAAVFGKASREWAALLEEIGGPDYPALKKRNLEVVYNRLDLFRRAGWLYGLALLVFLGLYVVDRRGSWWGLPFLIAAAAVHLGGLILRWMVAGRQPFSDMYESMITIVLGASILGIVLEGIFRRNEFGVASAVVGALIIAAAEYLPDFNPFVRPLMPALQSFWMTLHVPCMMFAYGGALVLGIVGHLYVFTGWLAPHRVEQLRHLDRTMYRALQVTALFMLAGVSLGAVWAGEAWGRPWGWDMKENWALISLLFYLACLHGRMLGLLRGAFLAGMTAIGAALVVLTYYGVNVVFGSGLHSYGWGDGRVGVLIAVCGLESVVAGLGVWLWFRRPELRVGA